MRGERINGGKIKKSILEIAVGAAVGVINGMFGGGGGMLCVPLLGGVLGESVRVSHATTVLVILPVCLVASIVYVANGYAQTPDVFFVMAGTAAGGALGSLVLKTAPPKAVNAAFALIMAAAGAVMIWR